MIVPCTFDPGYESTFKLEIFGDTDIRLKPLKSKKEVLFPFSFSFFFFLFLIFFFFFSSCSWIFSFPFQFRLNYKENGLEQQQEDVSIIQHGETIRNISFLCVKVQLWRYLLFKKGEMSIQLVFMLWRFVVFWMFCCFIIIFILFLFLFLFFLI